MQLNNQEKSLISLVHWSSTSMDALAALGSFDILFPISLCTLFISKNVFEGLPKDLAIFLPVKVSTYILIYLLKYLCQFTNNFRKISEPPLCQYWALTSTISHLQGSVSQMTRHNNDFIRYLKLSHLEIALKRTWLQSWDVWWQQSLETWESLSQHTEN